MGRATRWLRSFFAGKKDSSDAASVDDSRERNRWSFKSPRHSSELAQARLRSDTTVTAAAAASQVAVAVAQFTSLSFRRWLAAVEIQRVFRGFLAKKALRALKALVKLQALVRGYLVRKQTAVAFHSMQALIKAQAKIRAQRCRHLLSSERKFYQEESAPISLEASSVRRPRLPRKLNNASPGRPNAISIDPYRPELRPLRKTSCFAANDFSENSSNSSSSPYPDIARISVRDRQPSATAHSTPRHFMPPTPTRRDCSRTEGELRGRFVDYFNRRNYMNNTQSFEAKVRSQSAPKQRPENAGSGSRRLPLSEVLIEPSRASVCSIGMKQEDELCFKRRVMERLDRARELRKERRRDLSLRKLNC